MEETSNLSTMTSEQQMNFSRLRDKMAHLNTEFISVLNHFMQSRPSYDFSDTVKSYLTNVQDLLRMYKMEPTKPDGDKENGSQVGERKIAKATRRIGVLAGGGGSSTDSPKEGASKPALPLFAASSPSTATSKTEKITPTPRFGDISVIAAETPAPISEPAVGGGSRKRAIRGGGPLGGAETVVFRGSESNKVSSSTPEAPIPTIKLPEPTPDFWTKKAATPVATTTTMTPTPMSTKEVGGNKDEAKGGSLFSFMNKGKSETPAFAGFSFGKKPEEKQNDDVKKEQHEAKPTSTTGEENGSASSSSTLFKFGQPGAAPAKFPSFGGNVFGSGSPPTFPSFAAFGEKKDEKTTKSPPTFPSMGAIFGKADPDERSSAGPAFPSMFGKSSAFPSSASDPSKSAFGSSASLEPPKLTFGSGTGSNLFAGLAAKASESNESQSKEEDEEYEPPKPENTEVVEADAILSLKGVLFKFEDKKYKKIGVGMVHVKETDGKRVVVMRASNASGSVMLNALVNASMKVSKADEKGDRVRLVCPVSSTEMATHVIRFAKVDEAADFIKQIEESN